MSTVHLEIGTEHKLGSVSPAEKPVRGLTHKAYLNGFASLLDTVVKGGVMAFVTPLLVASLGSSMFGVWQILGRLVTYMHPADGRPTQALKWVIASRQGVDDAESKRRYVGSALGVWLLFLPLLIAVSVGLVFAAPYVTQVSPELYFPVRIACTLLAVNFLLMQLVSLPDAVLRGMNLGYKRMGLQAGLSIVGGLFTLSVLYLGGGLIGLAGAQVILAGITGVLFLLAVKKFVPWFGIVRPRWGEVRSFFKLSIWWSAWTVVNKFLKASDILILGLIASSSAVTIYTLTGFASVTLLSVVTILLHAIAPGLGGVIGQQHFARAAALRAEMMTLSWLMLTAFGSTILIWNRSFVSLWVGAEHYAGFWTNLLIVLMAVQLIFIRNDTYVIDLTLQLREKVVMGVVAVVISITLSAALIPRLGIAGLCLGMIAGRLSLTIAYPFVIRKRFGPVAKPRWLQTARLALTMLFMFGASAYLGNILDAANWSNFVLNAGVSFGLALVVALVAGLAADARRTLAGRLLLLRTLFTSRETR